MSLNPLNELKRRLEDDTTALPKRLCLARNVVHSHYFPAAPKERVVAEWLNGLTKLNKLNGGELKSITGWLSAGDGLSSDLKSKLIQIVSEFVQCNPLKLEEVQSILDFVENEKISKQVTEHIDENLIISVTLLQTLSTQNEDRTKINALIQRILKNLVKHYKESKKKLEFIIKFLDGKNLETIFGLLDTDNHNSIIEVCQNILFPVNKKSFFVSFLQTLIRKDNIDDLIAEKGDNIQSVLKIMSAFFEFPSNRTTKDHNFLCNFVDVFVSCFQGENQLIFAFYIMVSNSLNMPQNYLTPNSAMPSIIFEENNDKIKRSIFLRMLKILLQNEVDITTRLTDTFGEKISKAETRKNFSMFIQGVLMGLLKLEGKPDKTTMNIINTALKLDPMLIEQKMDQILPPIMAAKKNSSAIMETYTSMLKCLLQTLFKLSRGTSFITQILPNVKLILEASNTEQFGLIQKKDDSEKIKSKIITGNDVMPKECVDMYGKWTSELMFRQNSELLVSLQKDFEIHCLMMLEEGFVSPSIITLCEVLSAILSSFFENSKMADHTVPRHIAEDFWNSYRKFENECLKKLGECVLKLNYDVQTLKEDESATTILTSHRVAKYLSTQCLKANIIGPKCAALSKLMYRISKNLRHWIQDNFEYSLELKGEKIVREEKEILVEDAACDLLTNGLEILSEVIFASKRITLDYKFLDSIFELQHLIHCILGCNTKRIRLTDSICKKKTHISRLAAYTVADISSWIERTAPSKMVRQHLENSVVIVDL
ncbi:hypothetical protein MSG28_015638 [Choristoneura fumiferana]|uniref:Uncharacterized protein n=1 Tax=Choristoneura fumiferana TaxID=7141 RepID=A0ACC0KBE5_CHOFU|nr:hypothetical protein MSG28_015638 [Choristoneura fumiferana]